jgi:predicted regulator of amino acid metabolism with ACT domain
LLFINRTYARAQGSVLLTRQRDQPGIVAGVSSVLAADNVNISFMTVGRTGKDQEAIMAIGIDSEPSAQCIERVAAVKGIKEAVVFKEAS